MTLPQGMRSWALLGGALLSLGFLATESRAQSLYVSGRFPSGVAENHAGAIAVQVYEAGGVQKANVWIYEVKTEFDPITTSYQQKLRLAEKYLNKDVAKIKNSPNHLAIASVRQGANGTVPNDGEGNPIDNQYRRVALSISTEANGSKAARVTTWPITVPPTVIPGGGGEPDGANNDAPSVATVSGCEDVPDDEVIPESTPPATIPDEGPLEGASYP